MSEFCSRCIRRSICDEYDEWYCVHNKFAMYMGEREKDSEYIARRLIYHCVDTAHKFSMIRSNLEVIQMTLKLSKSIEVNKSVELQLQFLIDYVNKCIKDVM